MSDNYNNTPIGTQVLSTLPNDMPNDSFYTLIVEGDNQGFDSETRYIPLDLVSNVSISANSNITTYPIMTGDIISDHKYDNPRSVEISGKFSLNGKYASSNNPTFAFSGDKGSRLKNIEDYFFALRKYGKFITLVSSLNGNTRFSTINNLVIKSLRFTRNYNNLDFSLSLDEIYTYENDNELDLLENVSDPNLPTIGAFKSCDFAKDVLSYDAIDEMTINKLADNGLICESFATMLLDVAVTRAVIALSVVVIVLIIKASASVGLISASVAGGAIATIGAMSAIPVLGWIAIGVGALVLIGLSIWKLVKFIKKTQLIDEFKGYKNDKDNYEESERMKSFLSTIRNAFNSLAKNNNIKFYHFTSNTAKQITYLTIDDNIYSFSAEQVYNGWSLSVVNTSNDDEEIQTKNTSRLVGSDSLFSMTPSQDAIFGTGKGTYVYVLNKAIYYDSYTDDELKTMLNDCWKNGSLGYLGYTKEEMKDTENIPIDDIISRFRNDGIYKDLTQFVFVVTSVKLTELEKALNETILKCFRKDGYK